MATHKNFRSLIVAQRTRLDRMEKMSKETLKKLADESIEDFKELTSGSVPQKTLRQIRPFRRMVSASGISSSRRVHYSKKKARVLAGASSIPLLPINEQSGDLRRKIRAWKISSWEYRILSTSKHSHVLSPTGLPHMVARGLYSSSTRMGELEKRYRGRLYLMRQALQRAGRK